MKTVIFDLDGTLADTSGDLIAAANHCFRDMGMGDLLDPAGDAGIALRGGRMMLQTGLARMQHDRPRAGRFAVLPDTSGGLCGRHRRPHGHVSRRDGRGGGVEIGGLRRRDLHQQARGAGRAAVATAWVCGAPSAASWAPTRCRCASRTRGRWSRRSDGSAGCRNSAASSATATRTATRRARLMCRPFSSRSGHPDRTWPRWSRRHWSTISPPCPVSWRGCWARVRRSLAKSLFKEDRRRGRRTGAGQNGKIAIMQRPGRLFDGAGAILSQNPVGQIVEFRDQLRVAGRIFRRPERVQPIALQHVAGPEVHHDPGVALRRESLCLQTHALAFANRSKDAGSPDRPTHRRRCLRPGLRRGPWRRHWERTWNTAPLRCCAAGRSPAGSFRGRSPPGCGRPCRRSARASRASAALPRPAPAPSGTPGRV